VALLLRKSGVTNVRPLEGGLDAWKELGLPLEGRGETELRIEN
jgi:rhodanese-related sulfurtransferase